jgi:hypothetical protein
MGAWFFRLWLFFSAIWIAVSMYGYEPKTYEDLWRAPKFEFAPPGGQPFVVSSSKSRAEIVAQVAAEVQRYADQLAHPIDTKKISDEILEVLDSETLKINAKAKLVWVVTCVPPLAVLVAGLCIAWILRGFRPNKPASTT